jgi:hypothetical protein
MFGELIPVGGGDPIPLLKRSLLVGRRESCDIVLRFSNVSAHHCQLTVVAGYWYVRDLNSRNGTKVNGVRVAEKRVDPGDVMSVAKHKYELRYSPVDLGAVGPPPPDAADNVDIFSQSLLQRAGLESHKLQQIKAGPDDEPPRYDVADDRPGQMKTPGVSRKPI